MHTGGRAGTGRSGGESGDGRELMAASLGAPEPVPNTKNSHDIGHLTFTQNSTIELPDGTAGWTILGEGRGATEG